MQEKPDRVRPLTVTIILWLCSTALLFLAKAIIEAYRGPIAETWIDLALVLTAYLFFFALEPLQKRVSNKIRKRARRKKHSHTQSV